MTPNPFSHDNLPAIQKAVSDWYGSYAPSMNDYDFVDFASRSIFIAQHMSGNDDVTLSVKDAPTAYVELDKRHVVLPRYYFSFEAMTKIAGTEDDEQVSAVAVAAINGSTAHEGLHIRYTRRNPLEAVNLADPEGVKLYGQSLACSAYNLAEDVYIEARGYLETFGHFLHMKNAILFPIEKAHEFILTAVEHMGQEDEAANALNAMIALKNTSVRDLGEWTKNEKLHAGMRKMLTAIRAVEDNGRAQVAMQVLRMFNPPPTPSEDVDEETMWVVGSGESDEELAAALIGSADSEAEELAKMVVAGSEEAVEKEGMVTLEKMLIEQDVMIARSSGSPNPLKVRGFDNFARLLSQLKVRNNAPGSPRNKGSRIVNTRISRIATDGKIFANMDGQKPQLPPEVIILGDASGSMESIWSQTHATCQAAFEALQKTGVSVAQYFHSSPIHDGCTPLLIHTASYKMRSTSTNIKSRFDRSHGIPLQQNFDGVVIKRLAKAYTGRPARRVLIVISDGIPAGMGYSGHEAIKHTKEAIDEVRAQGISVICFSVSSSVVRANDRIYGAANNVDCSTGNLDAQFKQLFARLMAEGR